MSKRPQSDNTPIDLGFSALLERAAEVSSGAAAVDSIAAPDEAAESVRPESADPFERLASESNWRELIAQTEPLLSEGRASRSPEETPDSDPKRFTHAAEARLWWVLAQLELGEIPRSILAAPFETAERQLGSIPKAENRALLDRVRKRMSSEGAASSPVSPARSGDPLARLAERYEPTFVTAPDISSPPNRSVARAVAASAAVVLLAVAAWATSDYWGRILPSSAPTDGVVAAGALVGNTVPVPLIAPVIDPMTRVSQLSALSQDFKSLDMPQPSGHQPMSSSESPVQQVSQQQSPPNRPGAEPSDTGTKSPPKSTERKGLEKEKIDTTGPIVGSLDPSTIRRRPRAQQPPGPFNPNSGREPLIPKVDTGVRDGSVYRVLVGTRVRSAPSLESRSVSFLEAGDRVFVTQRVGRWCRLRARDGKTGFVLAHDVAEDDDSYTVTDEYR